MELVNEEDKVETLRELREFLKHCTEITEKICETLSWDEETLLNRSSDLVACPVDPGHRVPRDKQQTHTDNCTLRSKGLTQNQISNLVPSSQYYYEKAANVYSTIIDKGKLNQILRSKNTGVFLEKEATVSSEDATVKLTPNERLAIHQSVISAARDAGKPVSELSDELLFTDLTKKTAGDGNEPQSKREMLAASRDQKRRRQTYRAKNVHITKKSYTEVIREVIENQTEMLKATAEEKQKEERRMNRNKRSPDERSRSQRHRRSRSPRERSKTPADRSRSPSNERSRSPEDQKNRSQVPSPCRRSRSTSPSRKRSRSRSPSRKSRRYRRSRSSSRSRRCSPHLSDGSDDNKNRRQSKKHKHKKKHKKHKSDKS